MTPQASVAKPSPFVSYPCPWCGKEFPTRRIAERHIKACAVTEADAQERTQDSREVAQFEALVAAGMARKGTHS